MAVLSGIRELLGRFTASLLVYPLAALTLRTGRWNRSRRLLSWVIRRHPRHFAAHLQLGRLHLRMGDRVQALRLFNQARWIDPFRFEETELPHEIHRALERDPLFQTHDLVVGPESRAVSSAGASGSRPRARRSEGSSSPSSRGSGVPEDRSPCGDFEGPEEYDRFRDLPPITREEIEAVDWERLLDRLRDDDLV